MLVPERLELVKQEDQEKATLVRRIQGLSTVLTLHADNPYTSLLREDDGVFFLCNLTISLCGI